jgi:hypothetical protein
MYKITPYHLQQAKHLGVEIKPSSTKFYKLDVYKNGEYLTSIGDRRYKDYIMYKKIDPELAEKRRNLYWLRHKKENVPFTRGWYSLNLLW